MHFHHLQNQYFIKRIHFHFHLISLQILSASPVEKIYFLQDLHANIRYLHSLGCQMKYFSNHHKTERDKTFAGKDDLRGERKKKIGSV
jgi:hypothetical protein